MDTTGYVTTPTPFPSFIIHNAVEAQQIQVLHQIQNHTITAKQIYLFLISQSFPFTLFSPEVKMHIYHMLLALPIPEISNTTLMLLILFQPIIELLILTILGLIVYWLFRLGKLLLTVIARKFYKEDTKTFLKVTFPAQTNKSAYATEQLYTLIHTLARQQTFWQRLALRKKTYSLEIISTKEDGIRYILVIPSKDGETLKKSLYSYLPGIKITETEDYLGQDKKYASGGLVSVVELRLSDHIALPLNTQKNLDEHDPISYFTGTMTKLQPTELVAYQVVVTPILSASHKKETKELNKIHKKLHNGKPLAPEVFPNSIMRVFRFLTSLPIISLLWWLIKITFIIFFGIIKFIFNILYIAASISAKVAPAPEVAMPNIPSELLSPYEKELKTIVKDKLDQSLYEVSIRMLVYAKSDKDIDMRISGFVAALGPFSSSYQSLISNHGWFTKFSTLLTNFRSRIIPNHIFSFNPILSTSELADLYHFPYTSTTQTEGLVKVHSKDLPVPLSLKKEHKLDVVFGTNTYGGEDVSIGLTDDERSRHVYAIGQTGSGKSTVMFHMAKDDIQKGRGVAVIDPHGDLIEDLLATVPEKRIDDFIYVNPFDIKHPVGINLLQLSPTLDEDELELEKELVAESVVSIFRRVFSNEEQSNAHRIEYILRNTIYTAFAVEERIIFTVYQLLNDPKFRKQTITKVTDENLLNFWKNEFDKAGNFQVIKMVSGVTAKVGRFLFSPTAKRILEQPISTINFDDILESEKILLCNLSEGKLGEDTAQLLGTTIITKLQQAAYRRSRKEKTTRKPFYLFIDEFQNFATSSFTKLLSGGRKFGIRVMVVEQSTAQQKEQDVTNVILANTGTVICFKTASPIDEELLLPQFSPYVAKGEIMNLARYYFYMKLGALTPEEPFSGKTLPITTTPDPELIDKLIRSSRKKYAITYVKKEKTKVTPVKQDPKQKPTEEPIKGIITRGGVPRKQR